MHNVGKKCIYLYTLLKKIEVMYVSNVVLANSPCTVSLLLQVMQSTLSEVSEQSKSVCLASNQWFSDTICLKVQL